MEQELSETFVGFGRAPVTILAQVVQRVDYSIQWINRYPTDKMYSNQYILFAGKSYLLLEKTGCLLLNLIDELRPVKEWNLNQFSMAAN